MKNTKKQKPKLDLIELIRFEDSYVDDDGGVHFNFEFQIICGRMIYATFPYTCYNMDAQYKAAKLTFEYYVNEEKELDKIQELRTVKNY